MNIYWFIAFLLYSVGVFSGGVKYEGYKSGEADALHDVAQAGITIDAQKSVIGTIEKQQSTTEGVDNAYQKNLDSIGSLYVDAFNVGLRQSPTPAGASLPAVCGAASRPNATASARACISKSYKLTPQQCDDEAAKLVALQAWVTAQRALIPGK